jgi:ferric-dicitrate binding protein FerR (iron transport regulator)
MSRDESITADDTQPDTEMLVALIRGAGRREQPPEPARQMALAVALEAWRAKTAHLRRRTAARWTTAAAIAAGAAGLALYALLPRVGMQVPATPVATLERSVGLLEARLDDGGWRVLDEETSLLKGTRLRTGAGARAALRLAGGASLRLAEDTEVTLASPPLLELVGGRAYVDSSDGGIGSRVEIVTSIANATDVGTQFEVSLSHDRYRLRVREGRVLLRHGHGRTEGAAGEELAIGPEGFVERGSVPVMGAEWRWVESIATAPDVNDQPVTQLLDWVARETGRPIRFKDAEVERRAASTILHGSIRNLAPLDALSLMLATTDLDYVELSDGTLLIQARPVH